MKITHYEKTDITHSCIYILYLKASKATYYQDVPVYVGKSKRGLERIFEHKDKEYDYVIVINCAKNKLDELEKYYIEQLKPHYNKTFIDKEKKNINKCVISNILNKRKEEEKC